MRYNLRPDLNLRYLSHRVRICLRCGDRPAKTLLCLECTAELRHHLAVEEARAAKSRERNTPRMRSTPAVSELDTLAQTDTAHDVIDTSRPHRDSVPEGRATSDDQDSREVSVDTDAYTAATGGLWDGNSIEEALDRIWSGEDSVQYLRQPLDTGAEEAVPQDIQAIEIPASESTAPSISEVDASRVTPGASPKPINVAHRATVFCPNCGLEQSQAIACRSCQSYFPITDVFPAVQDHSGRGRRWFHRLVRRFR